MKNVGIRTSITAATFAVATVLSIGFATASQAVEPTPAPAPIVTVDASVGIS